MHQKIFLYIYNHFTKELEDNPKLDKNNLAIDPEIINRRGWLDGYFKTIKNTTLSDKDVLSSHCFLELGTNPHEYVDDNGNKILSRIEPCGTYGISNHRKIDDLLSEKYKLPFAPLTEEDKKSWGDDPWPPEKVKWW